MFIEGRGPRAGQQILVVPPLPENFVRGLNMAGATAGLVGNGLEAGGAAALAVAPEPLSKLGAVLLGLVAVDGAQANVRTLKNWGEPTPSFLNQGVTALASQIANPQEARVMGGIVDGGVHLGAGIYSATKIPVLLQQTPGLKAVEPANVEAAAGETSAVAKLEPVVATGETAATAGGIAPTAQLVGIADAEASSLKNALKAVQVDGQPVVRSVEAFGSRAGSTYRGRPPSANSDLDIYVTLISAVANTPAKLQDAMEQIKDISDLFGRVKGFPVNPVVEIDVLAPAHKLQFSNTPFIPLPD
jgi:hypothetical protein